VICAMNPVTGRERQWGAGTLRAADPVKRVVVVGGGPAGMRAAATAATRGHRVTLIERDPQLGGHFNLLARLPGREEWSLAIGNFTRALEVANVAVELGVEATPVLLHDAQPDALVLATGARYATTGLTAFRPDRPGIPGADADHVLDVKTAAARVLEDPLALGRRVVMLDESGMYMPLGIAEIMANAGVDVEVISPQMFVGEQTLRQLDMPHIMPRLAAAGVRLSAQQSIEGIDGATVHVYGIWGGSVRAVEEVDTVVISLYRVPDDALAQAVKHDGFPEVHLIGDCLAPRSPAAVIYDGEKLGRERHRSRRPHSTATRRRGSPRSPRWSRGRPPAA